MCQSSEGVARCGYRYVSSIGTARRSIARVSLAIRSSSPRSHREAGGLFYPHSCPTSQASLLRLTAISASISSLRGSLAPVGRPRQEYGTTSFAASGLIGRIVALAGLSLSPSRLPPAAREAPTTHPPHTNTPTDEPRSSLVLPLPSLSFTSRTPLLVIPPPTPCFELNRK